MAVQDIMTAAAAYVRMGWQVTPLHDVTGGTCSCGSADPNHDGTQGGKHPVWGAWQNGGLSDLAAVRDAWAARPSANIGILTGRTSGIWVLDVDPVHGGDHKLAALVGAWGALPETFTVRTGSGGVHYYWRMPDFDLTNSRGQLPPGLDVRARGGQVVAPPSRTLKGEYSVALAAPVVDAPGWLLRLVRPPDRAEMPPSTGTGPLDLLAPVDPGRGAAYALAAARGALGALATAMPGSRNDTAFKVACRLAEMLNAPWSGLNADQVWAAYMEAAMRCDIDGGFSQTEAYEVLVKATRHVAGRPAELPPADFMGTVMPGWSMPDFDQAGQGPAMAASPFSSPGAPGVGAAALVPVDPFESAVLVEMGRLRVRAEAQRRLAEAEAVRTDFAAELLTGDQLDLLPAAVALIDGYLDMDTVGRVNGPSGHGKSFVTLDMACSVQQGRAWHGRAVTQAQAWYVVGEGVRGMRARERAWCERVGIASRSSGVLFLPRALQVDGPEWASFVRHATMARPGLIVFDTQARMTVGVNENDAAEMGKIIAALDALRRASGACVLLVHHRGLSGEHGRGSSAVRGALDSELDVSRTGVTVTVRVTKQKDQAERPPLLLTMNPLGESMVLVGELDPREERSDGNPFVSPREQLSSQDRACFAIAHALMAAAGSGLTRSEAQAHARVAMGWPSTDAVKRTLRRAWSDLVGLGRIAKADRREAYFFLDLDGLGILSPNPDKMVQGGPEVYIPD